MTDNETLARSLYEAWNERNFDEMAEATAPDGTITIIGSGDTFEGPEGARRFGAMWADGFPDGGTHTGTLVTSMGDIPATGRSMTLQLCDVTEFQNGKVRRQRTYFDTGSMMAQLGLTAGQAASAQQ